MMLKRDLESLLFVAAHPLSVKKLAQLTKHEPAAVASALAELQQEYNRDEKGIQIQQSGQQFQFVSSPLAAKLVTEFLRDEQSGDLTDPAIETLTIIAYRGPLAKSELDQIRGVNCSLILRHLLIKGLVEMNEDKNEMVVKYSVTFDFLRFLGLRSIAELPDYEKLRHDENLRELLAGESAVSATEAVSEAAPSAAEAPPVV